MLHRKEDNKLIASYILPSICSIVVSFAYNVVYGMFLGQVVGENALAAVNITVPFTEIMTGLASMLAIGGAAVMAIRKGRGDHEGANHAFLTSTVSITAIHSVFLRFLLSIFSGRAHYPHLPIAYARK